MYSLLLRPSRTLYVRSVNARSTGGLFGRCVIVFGCAGTICSRTAEFFLGCNKIPLESSAVEQFPSCFIFQRELFALRTFRPSRPRMPVVFLPTAFYFPRIRNVCEDRWITPRECSTQENSVTGDLFFTTCNIAHIMQCTSQIDMLGIAVHFPRGRGGGREREKIIFVWVASLIRWHICWYYGTSHVELFRIYCY